MKSWENYQNFWFCGAFVGCGMESRGCGKKLINSLNIIEENLETTPNQKARCHIPKMEDSNFYGR